MPKKKSPIKADLQLDATGLSRPLPALRVKKAIDSMEPGQVLEVVANAPGTSDDLAIYAGRLGHELLGAMEDEGRCRFFIRKAGPGVGA